MQLRKGTRLWQSTTLLHPDTHQRTTMTETRPRMLIAPLLHLGNNTDRKTMTKTNQRMNLLQMKMKRPKKSDGVRRLLE